MPSIPGLSSSLSNIAGKMGTSRKVLTSAGRMMGGGARKFSGYYSGTKLIGGPLAAGVHGPTLSKTVRGFSNAGKMRMGAAAGGLGIAAMHNNARRGGYIPKSSGTAGLQPRSTGGATML